MPQAFGHGYMFICFVLASTVHSAFVFLHFPHLNCSVQLSMSNMEKRYRYKIIIIIIIIFIIIMSRK